MRFVYGAIAFILWSYFVATLVVEFGIVVSSEEYLLTTAIVIAGAMAGGG